MKKGAKASLFWDKRGEKGHDEYNEFQMYPVQISPAYVLLK